MRKKNIVVIPGSDWQIPIVQKIQSMGHRALTINPYSDSAAFPYADGYLQRDIFDEQAVIQYCIDENADAIISEECDIAMPIVAKYGKKLKYTVLSVESAHLFTDKYAMREFAKKYHFPLPEYKKCFTIEEAMAFYHLIGRKMIMKPLDSNSSRGVFTICNETDIQDHFEETLSYSRVSKAVLLERYIKGVEFTVDGIKTPKKHYSLAISEKKHFKHNENIASELLFTHDNKEFDYELLKKINDAFVDASCLEFGLTHAEYKCEDGVFYLIEIAARGGGNRISSDIVPFMSGVDTYKYLIDCSLGFISNKEYFLTPKYQNRAAVLKFFEIAGGGGIVKEIQGEKFLKMNEIVAYKFNCSVGDRIKDAQNDATRAGFYIACADTKERLDCIMSEIEKNVKIICQ